MDWMDWIPGVVVALIGVAGVLVSQKMSVKAAEAIRKEDRRIEAERRWDHQKREVYVDFLGALARLRRAGQEEEFAKNNLAEAGNDEESQSFIREQHIKAKEDWIAAHDSAMNLLTQISILSGSPMDSVGLEAVNLAAVASTPPDEYQLMQAKFAYLVSEDLQIPDHRPTNTP